MAKFNLNDYETVEERIRKFYEAHPDGRIITKNLTTEADRSVSTWVVKASIFLTAGEQAANLPKATGLAFEVDGSGMANQTAALENAETSAIGRCLANGGWSGSKRASRSEMEKAERGVTPKPTRNWMAEADKLTDIDQLRSLWLEAKTQRAPEKVLAQIKERADVRGATQIDSGAAGSVPSGTKGGKA
jgi:hypothetical protein